MKRRLARIRGFLAAAGTAIVLATVASGAQAAQGTPFGNNLIVNGDAEANVGAPSNTVIVKPAGWTTNGEFTAVQYGASGGFPDKTSPGPQNRGRNFFGGGNVAVSTASQVIDLSAGATAIDAGSATYVLSGWLGGFGGQADNAKVTVTFAAANGKELGAAQIGPVTPADRKGITGLLLRTAKGSVPAHATSATVVITATRLEGEYNDGYADNLSLVLKS
jgi:hypothetical protein